MSLKVNTNPQEYHQYQGLSKKSKLQTNRLIPLSRSLGSWWGRSTALGWNLDSRGNLWFWEWQTGKPWFWVSHWDWHPPTPTKSSPMQTDQRVDKNARDGFSEFDKMLLKLKYFLSTLHATTSSTIAVPHLGFFADRRSFRLRPRLLHVLGQIWVAAGTQHHLHQASHLDRYFWWW